MFRVIVCLTALAVALSAAPGHALEVGTKEQAIAIVQRIQDKFKHEGPDATIKAVMLKEFNEGDLYPFVFDLNGLNVGSGGNPVLVGKNLISLKDQDGKYLTQEMIGIAKGPGRGWISYKWPNPFTHRIEGKTTYIERMGDYFVGVGVWLPKF